MNHDHAGRLARAGEAAAEQGLDAVIVAPGPDLQWLVGYDAPPLERLTALLVRPDGPPALIVPELERARAVASPAGSLLQVLPWAESADPYAVLSRILGPRGGVEARYAVSDRMWATHLIALERTLPSAAFTPASAVLAPLRAVKDQGELDLLERAGAGADRAFELIVQESFTGRTERSLSEALGRHLLANGHDSVSFGIVGTGPNSASPHHEPGDRAVAPGDAVVMDFGGRVGGYGSDMTRTVAVGEPAPDLREVHEVVRRAQQAAFEVAGPGVPAQEVDRAARRVIEEAGFGREFIHRTGHGIGLEEHEPPYIIEGNEEPLVPGMCFSIEPGIYLQGRFGVRIEDIVTVTSGGARRLNQAPRDLVVVA